MRVAFIRGILLPIACAAAGLLTHCAPHTTMVLAPNSAAAKGDTFGYRKWISDKTEPDVVLIGIHGFCGASIDYANLGNHLLAHQPKTGLYAYEVRGQGSDPIVERRGDIGDPEDWYRDLFAFTQLVRERHPDAKVVWFGESMGALIAAHAWREAPDGEPPCDGLILSSPIVRFRDDIPAWTPGLVQIAATTLPLARVSLDTLAGGQDVQMTQKSLHNEQAKKNPYHMEQYTLRLDRRARPSDLHNERLRGEHPLAGAGAAWRPGLFQQRLRRARFRCPHSAGHLGYLPELPESLPLADVRREKGRDFPRCGALGEPPAPRSLEKLIRKSGWIRLDGSAFDSHPSRPATPQISHHGPYLQHSRNPRPLRR